MKVNHNQRHSLYTRLFKRWIDAIISIVALAIFSPIFIVMMILVRVKLGSPVFFRQPRPGRDERVFTVYKFRTMTDEVDSHGELVADDIRLTRFGRLLRSTSLDELPELWNIIRGDMSLVGPRPLLTQYVPLYDERQRRRHEVRPGLTGLAQINGRNAISWEEKFELDVHYIEHMSFMGDWKILLLTVKKVIMREGIHSAHTSTMEPFQGTQKECVNS